MTLHRTHSPENTVSVARAAIRTGHQKLFEGGKVMPISSRPDTTKKNV